MPSFSKCLDCRAPFLTYLENGEFPKRCVQCNDRHKNREHLRQALGVHWGSDDRSPAGKEDR